MLQWAVQGSSSQHGPEGPGDGRHLSASGMHAVRGALSALQGSKAEERPPARRKTWPLGRAEGGDISGHRLTQLLEQHTALRC